MEDLRIPPGPGAPAGIVVPAAELVEQFSRSSGPGGQGVNTTDSRVQLSLDVAATSALSEVQRTRALARLAERLNDGVLTIAVSDERSQHQNRVLARDRMATVLRSSVMPDVPRRPTKPTRGSQRRRVEGKKRRGELKRSRRRPGSE